MPGSTLPKMGIKGEFPRADNFWDVDVNYNWRLIDSMMWIGTNGQVASVPATGSSQGETYVISGTGQVAVWYGTAWSYYSPKAGMMAVDLSTGDVLYFDGTAWQSLATSISSLITVDAAQIQASMVANPALFYTTAAGIVADMAAGIQNIAVDPASLNTALNNSLAPVSGSGTPSGAPTGTSPFYTDNGTGDVYYYNGTTWTLLSNPAINTSVTSSGIGSAGSLIEADANGLIDSSWLPAGLPSSGVGGYANDAAYLAATDGAATTGDMYYNSTLGTTVVYNGTAFVPVDDKKIYSFTDQATATSTLNPTAADAFQYIVYDQANSKYVVWDGTVWADLIPASSADLAGLTDTNITTPANGDALVHNGTEWVNTPLGAGVDVADEGAITGESLIGNDTATLVELKGVKGINGVKTATAADDITIEQDVNSLVELPTGTLDPAADYLMIFDADAGDHKKVKPEEIGGEDNTFTVAGAAPGAVGQVVYNNAGTWELADHTDINKAAIAMIVEIGSGEYKLQTAGPVKVPGHGFTVGSYVFGDVTSVGDVSETYPTVDIVKPIAHVHDADTLELILHSRPFNVPSPVGTQISYKYIEKVLASNITGNNASNPALEFTGLVPGRQYELVGQVKITTTTDGLYKVIWSHAGSSIAETLIGANPSGTASTDTFASYAVRSPIFTATATTIVAETTNSDAGDNIVGDGTYGSTWIALREYDAAPAKVTVFNP